MHPDCRPVGGVVRHGQAWRSNSSWKPHRCRSLCPRGAGAKFMAFWRDAFWWLGYYEGLNRYLRSTFSCVLENDSLIVFDLRSKFEPSRN